MKVNQIHQIMKQENDLRPTTARKSTTKIKPNLDNDNGRNVRSYINKNRLKPRRNKGNKKNQSCSESQSESENDQIISTKNKAPQRSQ